MADWLCDVVTGNFKAPKDSKAVLKTSESSMYTAPTYPDSPIPTVNPKTEGPAHTRSTIHPSPAASIPEGFESAGAGRLVTFNEAQPLTSLIDNVAYGIGLPGGIPIAVPQGSSVDRINISTVGMCPGSGSSVLLRSGEIPDLLLTGEMSHHEALAATERGSVVISLSHTNSERGYLRSVMQPKLLAELTKTWDATVQNDEEGQPEVFVSEADRDPYGIMIWRGN
jgi:putative NIF3 family GTP cyclohydrolase 1 type 2